MKCPKCGYENTDEALSCGLCSEVLRPTGSSLPKKKPLKIPRELIIFIIGLVIYPLIHHIWFLDLMCYYLSLLIHELGHCLMYLVFGQLAVPKLDFVYGGGEARVIFTSGTAGPIIITGLLGLLVYLNRRHTVLMIGSLVMAVIYPVLAFSKAQDILHSAAGHWCEAVGAGICFYRCLIAGNARSFERPLYAVIGWWITIHGIGFCWRLAKDLAARADYIYDPVKYHDLAKIMDYTNWDFGVITTIFAFCYLIPVVLSIFLVTWKMIKPRGQ